MLWQRGAQAVQRVAHRRCSSHSRSRTVTVAAGSMSLTYPPPIVCNPTNGAAPTSAVIFLHGLGDSGHGWADVASQFQATMQSTRFIFPHAPRRPITLNWGMSMPGWFDIASLDDINQKEDDAGLNESLRYVLELIEQQAGQGIPAGNIAVCGFSQGGAIALLLLKSKTKVAAVAGLSTWLPLANQQPILSEENKDTPILMCHGDADNVVAYQFGRASHAKLAAAGATVDFATYTGMAHSACPQELRDLQEFLVKNLPK